MVNNQVNGALLLLFSFRFFFVMADRGAGYGARDGVASANLMSGSGTDRSAFTGTRIRLIAILGGKRWKRERR
jgi:hypothetical protein